MKRQEEQFLSILATMSEDLISCAARKVTNIGVLNDIYQPHPRILEPVERRLIFDKSFKTLENLAGTFLDDVHIDGLRSNELIDVYSLCLTKTTGSSNCLRHCCVILLLSVRSLSEIWRDKY